MLTDEIDPNAAVIWGARIDPTFENKIEVIAIFTGVKSPFIKGSRMFTGKNAPQMSSKGGSRRSFDNNETSPAK